MTNERRLSSMEASFKMEDMPFDSSCRLFDNQTGRMVQFIEE